MIHAGTAAGIAKAGQSGIAADLGLQILLVPTLCSSFVVDSGTAQGIGGDLAKISSWTGTDGATICCLKAVILPGSNLRKIEVIEKAVLSPLQYHPACC